MTSTDPLPLITLQPVLNSGNAWVALLLEADAPLDGAALARLLHDDGLAAVLPTLSCVVQADPLQIDPALAGKLPPHRLILRFPVALAVDPAHHAALAALHAAGFDLMVTGYPAAGAALCPEVASLAVTCPGHNMPAGCADWLRQLPGPHLALGTTEHVCPGFCKFHWLAGHLAGNASPTPKGDPSARSLLLRLLALVTSDADASAIEAAIKHDANLSYQLLKLVNSVAFAPAKQISSFGQAIALMGRRQLQRWLQLLLYARQQGSDAVAPLLPRAAQRARLLEALAQRRGLSHELQDQAFMAGMFSLLDVLFGQPLAEIIAPIHLPESVEQALLQGSGPLGGLLAVVAASEGPPAAPLASALAAADIGRDAWAAALIEATCWAGQISTEA